MSQSLKMGLAVFFAALVLVVAGSIWFNVQDDRRAEAFGFTFEPVKTLEEITARAVAAKNLAGSGKGLVVQPAASSRVGARQWTVSADGLVEGRAPDRGLTVVWTPDLKDGKVEWRCKVEPKGSISSTHCRDARRFER